MTESGTSFLFEDETEALAQSYLQGRNEGTVIILPDTVAIMQIKELLLSRHGAVDGSLFITFEELAARMVLAGTSRKAILLPEFVRKLIAREIAANLGSEEGRKWVEGDLALVLLGEFDKIWPNALLAESEGRDLFEGLPAENWHVGLRTGLVREFAAAYSSRMKYIAEKGIYDRVTLAHEAAGFPDVLQKLGIRKVVISETVFADCMLLELIKSVSTVAEVVVVCNPGDRGRLSVESMRERLSARQSSYSESEDTGGPVVKVRGAPDRRRELREVARTIRTEIEEKGLVPDDFGVFAESIEEYLQLGSEIFAEYGLEIEGGRRKISNLRLFTLLERIVELLDGNVTKGKLMNLLEHDFFPQEKWILRDMEADLAHLPEDAGERLRSAAGDDLRMKGGRPLWKWLERSIESSKRARTLKDWADLALEILEVASPPLLEDEEYEGESVLRERIAQLSIDSAVTGIASPEKPFGLTAFREALADLGRGSYLTADRSREGKILFTDSGLVHFRKLKRVFVLGANEEVLPSKPRDGMFLRLDMLDWISQKGPMLRTGTDAVFSIEGHKFDMLLHASPSITFSYVYSDERGRRLLPSTFVLQTMEKVTGDRNLLERIEGDSLEFSSFYPEDGTALSRSEFDRIIASLMSSGHTRQFEEGKEYQDLMSRKDIADSDPVEWRFPSERLRSELREKVLSATDLSEYSKCPFRYVASRVLAVTPALPPLNPLDRGSQMHEILRLFYESHPLEFLRTTKREKVAEELESSADAYFSQIYGGQNEMDLRFALHVSEVKSALREFIDREIEDERRMSGSITGLEQRFGFREQKEFRIGSHSYRGLIDRVETIDGSGDVIVYDYKTGNPDNLTKKYFRAGKGLIDYGIPLYSLYLRDVEGKRLAGAFYYMLLKSPGTPDRAGIAKRSKLERMFQIEQSRRSYFSILDDEGMDDELGRFRNEIVSVSDSISSCDFPVEPKAGECTFCRYISICRYTGGLG